MKLTTYRHSIAASLTLALIFSASSLTHADEPSDRAPVDRVLVPAVSAPVEVRVRAVQVVVDDSYWIGVSATALTPILRAQLIPEHGVVVESVLDDSPAATAGIQQHDVLLTFDDTVLKDLKHLVAAVKKSNGAESTVTLLRKGDLKTVKVTPTKRPSDMIFGYAPVQPHDISTIEVWLDRVREGRAVAGQMRAYFMRPGIAMPAEVVLRRDFPKDTSVTIKKEGDAPAEITVTRGDQTWKATEENLDQLPKDVQPLVKRALGQSSFSLKLAPRAQNPPADAETDRRTRINLPTMPPNVELRTYRRLESRPKVAKSELSKLRDQIEQLRQAVEKLQQQHNHNHDEE